MATAQRAAPNIPADRRLRRAFKAWRSERAIPPIRPIEPGGVVSLDSPDGAIARAESALRFREVLWISAWQRAYIESRAELVEQNFWGAHPVPGARFGVPLKRAFTYSYDLALSSGRHRKSVVARRHHQHPRWARSPEFRLTHRGDAEPLCCSTESSTNSKTGRAQRGSRRQNGACRFYFNAVRMLSAS